MIQGKYSIFLNVAGVCVCVSFAKGKAPQSLMVELQIYRSYTFCFNSVKMIAGGT